MDFLRDDQLPETRAGKLLDLRGDFQILPKIDYLQIYFYRMRNIVQTLCLLTLVFQNTLAQDSDADFTLVRKDEAHGIYVYERWINFPSSNPPLRAREVKGDFAIHSTVSEAIALLKNESRIRDWQDHVTEFKVYPTDDTATWREYSYHDIPWPVSDQDHFLQYDIQEGSTPEKVFIRFETRVDNKLAPKRKDVTRMHLSGSWLIEKTGNNRIHASYRILSKPIGIPRIFTDPVIRSNIMTTIREYIRILEEQK